MGLLGAITTIAGPAISEALIDVWKDYHAGRQARKGTVITATGLTEEIPVLSGRLSVPDLNIVPSLENELPINVSGEFFADESLLDWIDIWFEEEEKEVVLLIRNEITEDIFLLEYGFEEFSLSLWPGAYTIYAFIVDPELDDVVGFGYPKTLDLSDPNPIEFSGEGELRMDMHLFYSDELSDYEGEIDTSWDLKHMDESQFYNLSEDAYNGDAEAQFQLGKMFIAGRYFSDGYFVPQEKQNGFDLVELAAEQGHAKAKDYLS